MGPERAVAQLRRADNRAVGLAFAVSHSDLITCAHVVNAALGRSSRDGSPPGSVTMWLEFPFGGGRLDDHVRRRARVVSWLADRGSFDLHDVAVLRIDEDLPTGVTILPLTDIDPRGAVQMWGPTPERPFGGHVSGRLMGWVDKSRLQVDQELRGVFRVRPGFSGTPVWQPSTEKVVGILQASSVERGGTDAYVLSVDLILDACRRVPEQRRIGPDPVLTVLHLSDLRFGARHQAEDTGEHLPAAEDGYAARLAGRLADRVAGEHGHPVPDLIVVAGNVAEHARPSEYDMAYTFLNTLRDGFRLGQDRLVVVPGSRDVNHSKCHAYFLDREASEEEPAPPYWPKWEPFAAMFTRLNSIEYRMDHPWQFSLIPGLKVAIAGLNSTMAESHRPDDRFGWLGKEQTQWFAQWIEQARNNGWLRIGVLNHDPRRDAAFLRDADLFNELVAPQLNLILHGYPGGAAEFQDPVTLGMPAAGSASGAHRYQLIKIQHDRLLVSAGEYGPERPRESSERVISVRFSQVEAVFPTGQEPGFPLADPRTGTRRTGGDQDHDDLLGRMAEVCKLRLPKASIRMVPRPDQGTGYLHVAVVQTLSDGSRVAVDQYPVGACEGDATDEQVERFVAAIGSRYLMGGGPVSYKLVYDGPPAAPQVRERALRRRVELLSFAEYQLGYDLRPYAQRQAERLGRDSAYAPGLYVPQRYTEIGGYGSPDPAPIQEDLLDRLRGWLAEPDGHLVVVLGPFGHGKTFLLRELTRRMYEEGDPVVPVLVHLRDLEKAHDLNQLVAAQLTAGGERRIDLAMFRYLLAEGRVALLFDGFDELAVRVTYDAAARHLDTVLRAAEGRAKIVLASRDQHFLTDAEVFSALGDKLTTVAGRRLVKLADFNDRQIAAFLRNRLGGGTHATRWLDLLRNIKDLLGLSRNPRMLDFITRIQEDRLLAVRQRTEEMNAAGLYEELLNEWLQYELDRRDRPGGIAPPSKEQFWHAVTFLALRLWGSAEEGVGLVALGETADELAKLSAPESTAEVDQPNRDETAHTIGSGTLLVRDSEGRFTFVHTSVMEWIVARHIANKIIGQEQLTEAERREMSPLMVDFLCGLLGRERALAWAATQLADPAQAAGLRENALLIHKHLGMDIVDGRLAGSDLRGRDLSGQVLRRANLAGADLTEAVLVDADLSRANLNGSVLVRARLDRSRLTNADLRDADLTGASLLGADLTGARLEGARLRGAALVDAQISADFRTLAKSRGGIAAPSGALPEIQFLSRATGMRATAFGPDVIAAGGDDGMVRLWDPAKGDQVREWTAHQDEVLSVDFAADGHWLASGGAGGSVRIWNPADGTLVREFDGHVGRVWSVRFSPDGNRLASAGGDGVVKIWNTATGALEHALVGHIFVVWSVDFAPDGRHLASAGDGQVVRVWDLENGTLTREWAAHSGAVLCLRFAPDASLASAGADGALRIWHPHTAALVREWSGHDGPVWSVAISPDGRSLASAGDDRVVRLWDLATGGRLRELVGHTDEVNSVAFAADGQYLASTGTDRVMRVWNATTGAMVRQWTGHAYEINSTGFSPDGRWLAAVGDDRMVRIWNPVTGLLERQLGAHTGRVWSMAWAPGGRWLASAGADGLVRVWNPETGAQEHELSGHTGRVRCLRFTPDGSRLASAGDDRVIRIWDPVAGVLEREWTGHTGRVRSLSFASDGLRLASGGDDGMVRIWNHATGTQVSEWTGRIGAIWAVWFSPDRRQLAVGGTVGKVAILDSRTGSLEREWNSHTGVVSSVAFSPDGQRVVSAGTVGLVRIWDAASGTELCHMTGHVGAVWSVGFSPDGRLLVSAGADGVLRIWDSASGIQRASLLSLNDGWAVLAPDLTYKLHGTPTGEFWYAMGLCRFEPGELDPYLPALRRIPDDAPLS
jgi:WD40 repeat protein